MLALLFVLQINFVPSPTPSYPYSTWLSYGDSRTQRNEYQPMLLGLVRAAGGRMTWDVPTPTTSTAPGIKGVLARPSYTVAMMKALVDADLASMPSQEVNEILINLGVNDVNLGLPSQAAWTADMGYVVDALHVKYPQARISLMRVWTLGKDADCDTVAGWIASVVSARNGYAALGPDERSFVAPDYLTLMPDGLHYNAAGNLAQAQQWKTVLGY